MKLTDKVSGKVNLVCCAVLFVLAWLFWSFVRPEVLSYQEESQLFLFDDNYFASHWMLGVPGFISPFIVQFFNNVYLGAVIIAAIYTFLLCFIWNEWKITGKVKNNYTHYLLGIAFILLIWLLMAITNVKFVFLLAVALFTLSVWILSNRVFRKKDGGLKAYAKVLFIILFMICVPIPKSYTGLFELADWNVQKYDYMARCQNWEGIMDKAKSDDTRYYVSNAYINLAYGMKGSLSQRGDESGRKHKSLENVFPKYDGYFLTGCALSDIYYYLGLINTSNKYAHKALETLPDGNLSARMVKRIIETDIINGNYDDARKYLNIMTKTIFYRKWAEKNLALLGNEDAINNHKFYGYARRVRIPDDNINSGQKMDDVILSLIKQNNENYLAVQYYLLIPQLEHNDKKYEMYLNYVEKKMK